MRSCECGHVVALHPDRGPCEECDCTVYAQRAGRSRAKGVAFERQVAQAFEQSGYHVRGLEAGGDHFCVRREEAPQYVEPPVLLHVECKRAERLKLPEWLRQVKRDATPGAVPVLVFKQSRQPAYAVVPFDVFLAIMGGTSGD